MRARPTVEQAIRQRAKRREGTGCGAPAISGGGSNCGFMGGEAVATEVSVCRVDRVEGDWGDDWLRVEWTDPSESPRRSPFPDLIIFLPHSVVARGRVPGQIATGAAAM
jgi:hypothetical protein